LDSGERRFHQQTLVDGTWRIGAGDAVWPFYNQRHHEKKEELVDTSFVVEGEKTANAFVKQLGLLAMTPGGGFGWRSEDIDLNLLRLKAMGINNLFYIPDTDVPGMNKATKFQEAAWRSNIGCEILPMTLFWVDIPDDGSDFTDLIAANSAYNIDSFLTTLFTLGYYESREHRGSSTSS
jgi:hypothetical protein